jgi:hypothetical protein
MAEGSSVGKVLGDIVGLVEGGVVFAHGSSAQHGDTTSELALPPGQKYPVGHKMGAATPSGQYMPAGHSVQVTGDVAPMVAENVPPGHGN